jgi:hypothetical protein
MKTTPVPQPRSPIWLPLARQPKKEQFASNNNLFCRLIKHGSAAFLLLPALAAENPFAFKQWSSRKDNGKIIEARIDHIPSEKEVVIALKNGGQRLTLKRENLSRQSLEMLDEEIATVKDDLQNNAKDITPELIYKAVALGFAEALKKRPWDLSLRVDKITISSDGQIAQLRLEKNIGVEFFAPAEKRFFMAGKALVSRDKTNEIHHSSHYYSHYSHYYSHHSDKEHAVEGSSISLSQHKGDSASFKWRRMGVVDCAVLSQKAE